MCARSKVDVRERILDAAIALLNEAPDGFSIERVAAAAGLSRATVYRRFRNLAALKDALIAERGPLEAGAFADVRSRILEAALTEFARLGVHGATMQGIADQAGVSVMSVYNHFEDKEGLIVALFSEYGSRKLAAIHSEGSASPEAAVRACVVGALRLSLERRELLGLLVAPDPIMQRAYQRVRHGAGDLQSIVSAVLKKAGLSERVDARVAAASLLGMVLVNGLLVPLISGEEPKDVDDLADQITWLFLNPPL